MGGGVATFTQLVVPGSVFSFPSTVHGFLPP